MKTEVNVEEIQKLTPSIKSTIYLQVIGLQIFMIALLFSSENIIFTFLLLTGTAAITKGYYESRMQNKLKQIIE